MHQIMRKIGIDAGHRLPSHGSKCRHIHGHRYEIEALCVSASGDLHEKGEEAGMVLDFGFLKDEMMAIIDARCDHGLILSLRDTEALKMMCPSYGDNGGVDFEAWLGCLAGEVTAQGFALTENTNLSTKLYVMPADPTAENLAEHWFNMLAPAVEARSNGMAKLSWMRVWETPNCYAEFGTRA